MSGRIICSWVWEPKGVQYSWSIDYDKRKAKVEVEIKGDIIYSTVNYVKEFYLSSKMNIELLKGVGDYWETRGCHIRFQI